jgi:hypothetical protein
MLAKESAAVSSGSHCRLQRCKPLALATQHRAELVSIEKLIEGGPVRLRESQIFARGLDGGIANDLGQTARQEGSVTMCQQFLGQLRGTADR